MKHKNYIYSQIILLFVFFSPLYGCRAFMDHGIIKEKATKKAKLLDIDLNDLKEGKACKYIGFIGDNSVFMARKNGKIKLMLFSYTEGNFLQTCTYVYGE